MKIGVAGPAWTRLGTRAAAKRIAEVLRRRPGLTRRSLRGSTGLTDRLFASGIEHALALGWVREDRSRRAPRYFARQRVVGLMVIGAHVRRSECVNFAACLGAAALESPAQAGCPETCSGYQEGRIAV